MKKLLIVVIIIAAVVGISFMGTPEREIVVPEVQAFTVIEQQIESTVLATGRLSYGDERRVRSEVNARVTDVLVEEGDIVREGAVLVRLDREAFETDVENQQTNVALRTIDIERAELRIENLNIQLQRQETLFNQGAAQASTLEELRNQIAQAEVDLKMQRQLLAQSESLLAQAQRGLGKTVIRAPMSGLVSSLDIKEGEMAISTGADVPLMTLVDPTEIYSEIDVDEADIGNVRIGQPVRVFAVAYLNTPLEGTVTKIATSARQVAGKNSLVFPVEVRVADQDAVILRPGMSTRAEVIDRSERAWPLVPIEAVQEYSEGNTTGYRVWRVTDGNTVETVDVTLGVLDDRYQAINTGLSVDDRVVTGPYRILRTLKEGDAVTVADDQTGGDDD